MNRISRETGIGGRAVPPGTQRRLGRSIAGAVARRDADEGLDLFLQTRRSNLVSSSDESNGGRADVSIDILSSETGKHDYDWLLTPPGTPLFSPSEASEQPQFSTASTRNSSSTRSSLTSKVSRLSVSHTENGPPTRPTRSNSVTRSSISSTHSSSYLSSNSRTSALNTSSASITSRPSTPGNRPSSSSSSRGLTPSSRPLPSRTSSTTAKTRPTPASTVEKPRPAHSSRPSTPTSRPHISFNSSSVSSGLASRSSSRPSTPTRRTPATVSSAAPPARSASVGRASTTSSRNMGPTSRPSSPAPRSRAPVQPIIPPDFPLEAPPNLRTKLPERAVSAGRMRPGLALTVRSNLNAEPTAPSSATRRSASPNLTRGRLSENTAKTRVNSNGHSTSASETHRSLVSEAAGRRATKPVASNDSTGFGRTISKKSLDMALRHMDIRQNIGGIRGASLFPQSIRSNAKSRQIRMSDPSIPSLSSGIAAKNDNGRTISRESNGSVSENGESVTKSPDRESLAARASEPDIMGSYRYDSLLLKEDAKNTNWLHSIEDRSDQSLEFDHRFELLPEPFGIL